MTSDIFKQSVGFKINVALRWVVWIICLFSIWDSWATKGLALRQHLSAVQESGVCTCGLFDVVTAFLIAFIFDKGLAAIANVKVIDFSKPI